MESKKRKKKAEKCKENNNLETKQNKYNFHYEKILHWVWHVTSGLRLKRRSKKKDRYFVLSCKLRGTTRSAKSIANAPKEIEGKIARWNPHLQMKEMVVATLRGRTSQVWSSLREFKTES